VSVETVEGRLAPEARVGDYRIKKLVGEGAMGEVYLAQDLVLGRLVALKLLRREVAAKDGIERFLDEARATAGFSHPHIVTIYAVGAHDGRPYLVLEFLDGESLRTRCAGGALPERDALRTVRAIADAVAEAHGRGLVHADLKPENVMVPRDGRIRVVDFGLARLTGSPDVGGSGTPSYMAPERWRPTAPTPAIDMWSLGVILHELVTGSRPVADADVARLAFGREDPALPPSTAGWARIVRACLRRAPELRPSASDVVRDLTALIEPAQAQTTDDICPFPGLTSFRRADNAHYFGRDADLDAVLEALRTKPLVAVVGPSGVGKSSFVSAAVIPRLEESGAWTVVTCRPGAEPFVALAAALGRPGLTDALRDEPARLALVLGEHAARTGRRVLLFVDQFEEAFTLAPDSADAFCTALALGALRDESWRIVLTVRDDFLMRLAAPVAMRAHLGALHPLGPMTLDDLRASVTGPLRSVGYGADSDALADRLARDVVGQPASLALLQFACRALWDRRDRATHRVLLAEYDAIGGASGALATHAERVLAELTPEQVRQVRAIFLSLVGPDGTRRPRARRLLEDGHLGEVGSLLELLLERRLVVITRQLDDADPVIELAHEALSTTWPPLVRWLDETHEQRLLLNQVEEYAALWATRGRLDEDTWSGGPLVEAARKLDDWKVELPAESRAFLDASLARMHRQRRRRRWLVGTIGSVLLVVAAAAVIAAVIAGRAQRRTLAQQAQIKLAAADMGRFELRLVPFDWDPTAQSSLPPKALPILRWRLRAPSAADPHEPGRVYEEGSDLLRSQASWYLSWIETVEARSGPAFLEIDRGPDCAPSLLFLQRLPSYADRANAPPIVINVPTCAATESTLVNIPGGEFYRNADDANGLGTHDQLVDLEPFALDRTEVTRGAFEMYAAMTGYTNDDADPTAHLDATLAADTALPVVAVDYQTATNYCRFLGKGVPSLDQWQKAFRGGVQVNGFANPRPDRTTVWLGNTTTRSAGVSDGTSLANLSLVGSYPDDTSPYGVVDLAGNVSEWTTSRPAAKSLASLRVVVGSNWSEDLSGLHYDIRSKNSHSDRFIDFALGIRCVAKKSSR